MPPPLPPLPLNGAAQLMERGCARLGRRTSPAANAALSRAYRVEGIGDRPACRNCGFCQAGCWSGAKSSMDATFLPLAVRAGAEIRAEAFVTRIETGADGRATGVVYTDGGVERRQRARAVFLCAGAIETPRLLLMNEIGQCERRGRAELHGALRPPALGPFRRGGAPLQGYSRFAHLRGHAPAPGRRFRRRLPPPEHRRDARHLRLAARAGHGTLGNGPARAHARLQPRRRHQHPRRVPAFSRGNRVELSDERDARGLPKPIVHFTRGENERRLYAHADRTMRAIWSAAGAREVWAYPRDAHIIGTCRMGDDPLPVRRQPATGAFTTFRTSTSRTTRPSRARSSANPALTIMALSLRTADRFLERARQGDA